MTDQPKRHVTHRTRPTFNADGDRVYADPGITTWSDKTKTLHLSFPICVIHGCIGEDSQAAASALIAAALNASRAARKAIAVAPKASTGE